MGTYVASDSPERPLNASGRIKLLIETGLGRWEIKAFLSVHVELIEDGKVGGQKITFMFRIWTYFRRHLTNFFATVQPFLQSLPLAINGFGADG